MVEALQARTSNPEPRTPTRVPQPSQLHRGAWDVKRRVASLAFLQNCHFERRRRTSPSQRRNLQLSRATNLESVSHPDSGFTLLELLIVMTIILILAGMAIPSYRRNVLAAKEAVLKEDLQVMRTAINSYTVDKQKAPQTLDDLVSSGYLKVMPKDPITGRTDTWIPHQTEMLYTADQTESGIDDVHSGAQQTAIDGTAYNTW
jgi:general secretion pathway protein G